MLNANMNSTVKYNGKYPLHMAARDGHVDAINRLAANGHNVNAEDYLSGRPLHVAALFGKIDAAKALLNLGAEVDEPSYQGETALHVALMHQHYELAKVLILEGKASPNQVTDKNVNAFSILTKQLSECLKQHQSNPSARLKSQIDAIISTLNVCAEHCGTYCHATTESTEPNKGLALPVSLLLKNTAYKEATGDTQRALLELAQRIAKKDPSEELFCKVKNFLHVNPTGGTYPLILDKDHYLMVQADGHMPFAAAKLCKEAVQEFAQKLDPNADPLKFAVFKELTSIMTNAEEFCHGAADPKTAEKAFALYQAGKSILMLSGWDEHLVGSILSKRQQKYGVANSGDRYARLNPGINFYKPADIAKIDATFIHGKLNNHDQMKFEYDDAYQYGLLDQCTQIGTPNQLFGNCAWQSLRIAIEGLIYIELLNHGLDHKQAKAKAHEYFIEWDQFNTERQIERFFADPPGISVKALIDILLLLHHPKSKQPWSAHDQLLAKKIVKELVSPRYIYACKSWLNDISEPEIADSLANILPQYSVKMDDLQVKRPILHAFGNAFGKLGGFVHKAFGGRHEDVARPTAITCR